MGTPISGPGEHLEATSEDLVGLRVEDVEKLERRRRESSRFDDG